ncbi:MAG: hypothetical protein JOY95_11590 [Silvibacterium sp.]|nr:hypothetical protein [Silvibacterium sp.]
MPAPPHTRFPARWLILLLGALAATAQSTSTTQAPSGAEAAPAPRPTVSSIVQPALMEVQSSVYALNIARWKAPGDVRSVAQQNSASIQRDLSDTLPGLLTQADAAPGTVSSSFFVYRNIDALYDVLLRVYQTAFLAAPQNEADSLDSALQKLEAARRQLGDTILSDSKEHEAQIVQLQAALKAATAVQVQAPPPKTSVVDDGPAPTAPKKKKKPAAKPPANAATQTPPGQTP